MEKKRKLPARAAARSEQAAKKRNITPRERSETPAAPPPPPPAPEEPTPPPPPPLPKSIQVGKPLPTVEVAQSEDLSSKEYQSVSESGVLAESLARSRHRWISDGLFAKYWTKPHKRKGVLHEDPKNPPKESMTKVGTVTISIEPHVIEATMYVVKDPKPKINPGLGKHQQRPILQYGPPNGSMPPPLSPAPASATATPTPSNAILAKPVAPSPVRSPVPPQSLPKPPQTQVAPPSTYPNNTNPAPTNNTAPLPSPTYAPRPQGAAPPAAPPPISPQVPQGPSISPSAPASGPLPPTGIAPAPAPAPHPAQMSPAPGASPALRPPTGMHTTPTASVAQPATPTTAPGTPSKPTANDPVIALLAQKAAADVELRELMRRVAMGKAREGELEHFQKIIDQLNVEYRSKGGQQGPSADRLLVDGRTVKYFADEVRTILDIVLASNPNQKSSDLRPPPRSDPLVVLLVKTALEDQRTRDMIRRIAENRPGFTDAQDLKDIVDRLHRDMKTVPRASPAASQIRQQAPNGIPNGHAKPPNPLTVSQPTPQALRSKGPPPAPKPDITAVVFDFGTGDRYLFPKFSVLEYVSTSPGQQVVASFLIVRKGSMSEYGGDPELDYYQPVSIRLQTLTGRHLEHLARVVAPQEEVRRYMDDVMDNMTRAEYVLLAMRLPRGSKEDQNEGTSSEETKTNGSTPKPEESTSTQKSTPKPSVLWTSKGNSDTPPLSGQSLRQARDSEHDKEARYQRLISSVAAKDG